VIVGFSVVCCQMGCFWYSCDCAHESL
jgi:hypothetical protein